MPKRGCAGRIFGNNRSRPCNPSAQLAVLRRVLYIQPAALYRDGIASGFERGFMRYGINTVRPAADNNSPAERKPARTGRLPAVRSCGCPCADHPDDRAISRSGSSPYPYSTSGRPGIERKSEIKCILGSQYPSLILKRKIKYFTRSVKGFVGQQFKLGLGETILQKLVLRGFINRPRTAKAAQESISLETPGRDCALHPYPVQPVVHALTSLRDC